MNLFKKVSVTLLLVQCLYVHAQQKEDSLVTLPTVAVVASRMQTFAIGHKTGMLSDSLLRINSSRNLSDVLASNSQVFVKSYGLGSLASTSMRGAGAGHTAVLWNGFNIQSPLYGMLDMALVPSFFVNDVSLQYGGAGALWGSSAVGGTIALNNKGSFDKGFTVLGNLSGGSFSDNQQQLGIEISRERFTSSLKVLRRSAENDFEFNNTGKINAPLERQQNASFIQYGLLQQNYFRIKENQLLNTRFWYQFNDRNLPPNMLQSSSLAFQEDKAYRSSVEWKRFGKRLLTQARLAYFDENILYVDDAINLYSDSRSKVVITEIENKFKASKTSELNIGFNITYSKAISENYSGKASQNRTAVFVNYKIHSKNNKWNAVANVRQEVIDAKDYPFTSCLGFDGRITKSLSVRGSIAQHYRVPTINDLFWYQGGNKNLTPEKGWSEELGFTYNKRFKRSLLEVNSSFFNRNINDWIIWLPGESSAWSPENILQVKSSGLELDGKLSRSFGSFNVALSAMYNYTISQNTKVTEQNVSSLKKQLIYVPIHLSQVSLTLSYRDFSLNYRQGYTGQRYTSSDNSKSLPAYVLADVSLSKHMNISGHKLQVYFNINNLWNTAYQAILYRAMPLRSYQFGINTTFNKSTINKSKL